MRAGGLGVGGEAEGFPGETGGEQFVEAGFENRGFAFGEVGDECVIEVQPGDVEVPRAAGGGDGAEMPEAEDGEVHFRFS